MPSSRTNLSALVTNLALAVATLVLASLTTFPWCDELVLSDNPARWAVAGTFDGRTWPCTYNFLYPFLLSGWFKAFGISHTTTISLSVGAAFLTVITLLRIARRRHLFTGALASSAFVVLFWSGWNLSQIVTNGRPDSLTMLLTVLFTDALIPDPNRTESHQTIALTAFFAGMLMLTSVYMLPLLFVLGLLILIVAPLHDRSATLRKGFAAASAIIAAYLFIAIFYFLQHELIRFLGFYVYFNTITGYPAEPLPWRILHCYLYNHEAIVLAATTATLALFRFRTLSKAFKCAIVATLAIPLVMILGGRYEPYYSWAFHIPALFFLISVLSSCKFAKASCILLIIVGIGHFVYNHSVRWTKTAETRSHFEDADAFVKSHPDIFRPGHEIVVADDVYGDTSFFYPILRSGARPWFRGIATLSAPSDEEKFEIGLRLLVKDASKRKKTLSWISTIQHFMPMIPEKGFVLFDSDKNRRTVGPLINQRGHILSHTPYGNNQFMLHDIKIK